MVTGTLNLFVMDGLYCINDVIHKFLQLNLLKELFFLEHPFRSEMRTGKLLEK